MKMFTHSLMFFSVIINSTIIHAGGNIPDIRQNKWEYPVDYRSYENCYQFLQYTGHVGVDLCRPAGNTDVRAISDGCVEDFNSSLGSYGGTSGQPGGAILLRHQTSSRRTFYAVYGHNTPKEIYLDERKCNGGTKLISKGDVIATIHSYIGGSDHLHFGIHPDVVDPDKLYRGNGCNDSKNCGWVDPFVFLMGEEPGMNDPNTIPGNTFTVRRVGNYAWHPADSSCINAKNWYGLNSDRKIVRTYDDSQVCQWIYETLYPQEVSYNALFGSANACYQ